STRPSGGPEPSLHPSEPGPEVSAVPECGSAMSPGRAECATSPAQRAAAGACERSWTRRATLAVPWLPEPLPPKQDACALAEREWPAAGPWRGEAALHLHYPRASAASPLRRSRHPGPALSLR